MFYFIKSNKTSNKVSEFQYLLYIFCFQWLILLLIRFFYFSLFYFFQNKVSFTHQTITKAYVLLFVLWIAVFIVCCFRFRKKLRKGDFRKDSALQNKRGNLGLNLSKKTYISIGAFFCIYITSSTYWRSNDICILYLYSGFMYGIIFSRISDLS
ncbi:conserved membrane hypothetical protein [Listeria monocytogenes]|nr:conserved membrane hypothetical protein [Listeria monocytogenes]CUL16906.1 conserved membrane hypothetical protein [Listeria monocytogenes]